jgi:hypothetical protein
MVKLTQNSCVHLRSILQCNRKFCLIKSVLQDITKKVTHSTISEDTAGFLLAF